MKTSFRTYQLWRSIALSFIATALYTAALPPFGLDYLALLAAFPLALAVLDPRHPLRWPDALLVGMVFGELTTLAVGGYWLYHAAHGFFERSAPFSVLFTLVVTITHAGALIGAGVFCASRLVRLPPSARVVGFAALWVAWELARSILLYGCPWNLLGHAFSRSHTAVWRWLCRGYSGSSGGGAGNWARLWAAIANAAMTEAIRCTPPANDMAGR